MVIVPVFYRGFSFNEISTFISEHLQLRGEVPHGVVPEDSSLLGCYAMSSYRPFEESCCLRNVANCSPLNTT